MPPNDLTGNVIEPELGQHILSELADLNADFIELMTASGQGSRLLAMLPDEQIGQLRLLSKPAIRRLSGCAFALFDLHLQDVAMWQCLGSGKIPQQFAQTNSPVNGAANGTRLFTLSAMMYLRHLAEINRFYARLSFGACGKALEVISNLPLNQLREIAQCYPLLLRTRFDNHPNAWTDLLKLARRNDAEPMLPARILGYKHLYHE